MKKKISIEMVIKAYTEYEIVLAAIRANRLKRVDKRLQVIKLRMQGLTYKAIADKLGYTRVWVNKLCAEYKEKGIWEYSRHKYGGNHRSMSFDEEEAIIRQFDEKAEKGLEVTITEIKKEFDKKIGKDTGRGYIYMLLKRHDYRKVMPRAVHPQKADNEAINASKKLTKFTGD